MLVVLSSETDVTSAGMPLVVGLVNLMPAEAARSAERQFCSLLAAASQRQVLGVRFFRLDGADGGDAELAEVEAARLDGLIVTGAPPRAAAMRDEPCWPSLARLVDLARERAIPTVWSCLAAHAAVLHLDQIERRRLPRKLSGLVECVRADVDHPVAAGIPPRWCVPHSRYYELPELALLACGYEILSRSKAAGVDMFAKNADCPFLFFQGHPEYEARTLLREYRRDVIEFLSGSRDAYPDFPSDYFGPHAIALLNRFQERAMEQRTAELAASFPLAECQEGMIAPWRESALRIWANWLSCLHVQHDSFGYRHAIGAAPFPYVHGSHLALPHV